MESGLTANGPQVPRHDRGLRAFSFEGTGLRRIVQNAIDNFLATWYIIEANKGRRLL